MADIIIDGTADVPIWIQIRNRIIYLIRSGQLAEGDRLPSVREVAVKQNGNFNTKAYKDLERDGLIQTKRGSGTFVASTAQQVGALSDSPLDVLIDELLESADSRGIGDDELLFQIQRRLETRRANHG
mgnify:CR=1 FL=1